MRCFLYHSAKRFYSVLPLSIPVSGVTGEELPTHTHESLSQKLVLGNFSKSIWFCLDDVRLLFNISPSLDGACGVPTYLQRSYDACEREMHLLCLEQFDKREQVLLQEQTETIVASNLWKNCEPMDCRNGELFHGFSKLKLKRESVLRKYHSNVWVSKEWMQTHVSPLLKVVDSLVDKGVCVAPANRSVSFTAPYETYWNADVFDEKVKACLENVIHYNNAFDGSSGRKYSSEVCELLRKEMLTKFYCSVVWFPKVYFPSTVWGAEGKSQVLMLNGEEIVNESSCLIKHSTPSNDIAVLEALARIGPMRGEVYGEVLPPQFQYQLQSASHRRHHTSQYWITLPRLQAAGLTLKENSQCELVETTGGYVRTYYNAGDTMNPAECESFIRQHASRLPCPHSHRWNILRNALNGKPIPNQKFYRRITEEENFCSGVWIPCHALKAFNPPLQLLLDAEQTTGPLSKYYNADQFIPEDRTRLLHRSFVTQREFEKKNVSREWNRYARYLVKVNRTFFEIKNKFKPKRFRLYKSFAADRFSRLNLPG
eukprot:PhF_6_TR6142/c0_g1_i1/m.9117